MCTTDNKVVDKPDGDSKVITLRTQIEDKSNIEDILKNNAELPNTDEDMVSGSVSDQVYQRYINIEDSIKSVVDVNNDDKKDNKLTEALVLRSGNQIKRKEQRVRSIKKRKGKKKISKKKRKQIQESFDQITSLETIQQELCRYANSFKDNEVRSHYKFFNNNEEGKSSDNEVCSTYKLFENDGVGRDSSYVFTYHGTVKCFNHLQVSVEIKFYQNLNKQEIDNYYALIEYTINYENCLFYDSKDIEKAKAYVQKEINYYITKCGELNCNYTYNTSSKYTADEYREISSICLDLKQ